jgi:hypothetical protein
MGTRLVAGRDITWTDIYAARPVAMVSENLAREIWGSPSAALRGRIRVAPDTPWREVVGVVQDVRDNGLDQPPPTIVYWPSAVANFYPGVPWYLPRAVTFVVRSPLAGTQGLSRQIQQAVWSVNASLPVASIGTMQEVYERSLARTSFTLIMLGTGGVIALLLGVLGLYGVISYTVMQRRREIAVRLALGAQPRALEGRFVRHGVMLAGAGVAVGLGASAGVTRLMTSLLYEVKPLDPVTYAAVAVALTAVAAFASYLPARRASAVDPAEALAAE